MAHDVTSDLRELAAMITSSYARTNLVPAETVPQILEQAYRALHACLLPPPPPAPPVKAGRKVRAYKRRAR